MKYLYTGGQKSGKSRLAELKTLEVASSKPYYLATSEICDSEMQDRVDLHKIQRADKFITIEEPLDIFTAIKYCDDTVIIDCLTIWLNNKMYHDQRDSIFTDIEKLLDLPQDIVRVLNSVGFGVIPDNPLAREFIDLSGKLSQVIAEKCDEVHFCNAGLSIRMK